MICFKLIIFFFLYTTVIFADGINALNFVTTKDNKSEELKIGSIHTVKVEFEKSINLNSFQNKFINSSMYVLDVKKDTREFVVFVGMPNDKLPNTFEMKNITIGKLESQPPQSFAILDTPYIEEGDESEVLDYIIWGLFGTISLVCLWFVGLYFYRKYQKKMILRKKAAKLVSLIQKVETRNEFEKIYKHKKDFSKFTKIDHSLLDEYINVLNEIQYKKEWTDTDYKNIEKCLQKIQRSEII